MAHVAPVNFYKIIELVVRAEPDLSRDIVRHLNKVVLNFVVCVFFNSATHF